ncbi:MAG: hypothetical protein AAF616_04200 [Bacteroidota bacterium]
MTHPLVPYTIFIVGELAALIVFWLLTKVFGRELTLGSVLRGALERGFVYVMLMVELSAGLAFFGALKIATRLKDDDKISNDYFLTGNFISVLIAVAYYLLSKQNFING